MGLFGAVTSTVHGMGVANGSLYLAGRLMERLSAGRVRLISYRFVAQPVPKSDFTAGARGVEQVDAGNPIVAAFPRPPAVISDRFARGDRCFVARRQHEFAGFIWIAEHQYPEDEVRCLYVLPSEAAWDYDVYVEPQHRMGRLFAQLWATANGYLSSRGYRWTVSRISTFNPTSLAAHQRMGARTIGHGVFVVVGPLQLALTTIAPFVDVSLSRGRPTLRFKLPSTS